MYRLNVEKLLMLLKFKTVTMKYMIFTMYTTIKKFPKKCGKFRNSLITGKDRKMMISRKSSNKLKYFFPKHKQKHNVSLKLYHETNTKKLKEFLVDNKPFFKYNTKKLPNPSADHRYKYLKHTLNSMNAFILSLVIFFWGHNSKS